MLRLRHTTNDPKRTFCSFGIIAKNYFNDQTQTGCTMAELTLSEWAAISEILGMIAVIISLLLVVSSIRQNTAVMHTTNDNFLYQRQDAIVAALVTNPSLAELSVKHDNNEDLSEVEHLRLWNQHFRDLLLWELAFVRLKEGLFSPKQWSEWNRVYSMQFLSEFPLSWWAKARPWCTEDFAKHVDSVYAAAGR
jgi:hypothetical protein